MPVLTGDSLPVSKRATRRPSTVRRTLVDRAARSVGNEASGIDSRTLERSAQHRSRLVLAGDGDDSRPRPEARAVRGSLAAPPGADVSSSRLTTRNRSLSADPVRLAVEVRVEHHVAENGDREVGEPGEDGQAIGRHANAAGSDAATSVSTWRVAEWGPDGHRHRVRDRSHQRESRVRDVARIDVEALERARADELMATRAVRFAAQNGCPRVPRLPLGALFGGGVGDHDGRAERVGDVERRGVVGDDDVRAGAQREQVRDVGAPRERDRARMPAATWSTSALSFALPTTTTRVCRSRSSAAPSAATTSRARSAGYRLAEQLDPGTTSTIWSAGPTSRAARACRRGSVPLGGPRAPASCRQVRLRPTRAAKGFGRPGEASRAAA